MAAVARYLAEQEPLARLHLADVTSVLAPLIEAGLVATCAVIEFEVLWSTARPASTTMSHATTVRPVTSGSPQRTSIGEEHLMFKERCGPLAACEACPSPTY